jgi:phage terminase large subunit
MNNTINISIKARVFNEAFRDLISDEHRYQVLFGGAGSGKSYFIVERYIYKILKQKQFNLLVVRNTGKSNRDSTFALFKQVLIKWHLYNYFKINESDLRIRCILNGNEIIFAGLDDVEKLKSVTFSKGELTDIWIEEASEIQESDFNQLDVRLRGKGTKKQIVISFNPIDINHWLKKRFIDRKDDNIRVMHSTYKDNEFLDEEYKALLESYKETDAYYYDVYCLGNWGVLGKCVFDANKLQQRRAELKEPLMTGYFTYDYDGLNITNIRWVRDKEGYIKIYQVPDTPAITKYCIGGDTAGDGSDYYTAHVLDAKTGEQVAAFKNQFDADIYARQMYCLGKYYKNALIGIESNFDSYPIKELQRLGYTNQYVREQQDTYTGKLEKKYGFRTTMITRPVIISRLIEIVREHTELLNDLDTIEELLTIVRNEKGRIEAPVGSHDDEMMGLAIAHEIRSQVSFADEVIYSYPEFKEFEIEQMSKDYGEEIVVV